MNAVVSVRGLTKTYKLYASKADRVAEVFLPFGRPRHKSHDALHDINIEIQEGESIGIIGRNGSGKSTLLKILSGVLAPSVGDVRVTGKIASLLELGAGFNPELTGRENVYFNGALLGYTRSRMQARVSEIIAFADIGEFIDQPVKVYSSGMFVRLAFAVSIHVDPDILIIDEALAVGDVRFQKKCIDFMRRFKESGKTILFVSHDIYTVKSFCNRLILINEGKVEALGDPDEVANRYHQIMFPKTVDAAQVSELPSAKLALGAKARSYFLELELGDGTSSQWGDGAAWIQQLRVAGLQEPNLFGWSDSLEFEAVLRWNPDAVSRICSEQAVRPRLLLGFRLENSNGWVITNFTNSMLEDDAIDVDVTARQECIIRCKVAPLKLAAGHYFVTPGLAIGTRDNLFPVKEYTNLVHLYCNTAEPVIGQMRLDFNIEVLQTA